MNSAINRPAMPHDDFEIRCIKSGNLRRQLDHVVGHLEVHFNFRQKLALGLQPIVPVGAVSTTARLINFIGALRYVLLVSFIRSSTSASTT